MPQGVNIGDPLFREAVAVAKDLVQPSTSPERQRICIGLAALLYREACSIPDMHDGVDMDSNGSG